MQNDFPKELPSAADLDVVAEEQKAREATGRTITPEQKTQLAFYLTDALNKPTPHDIDNLIGVYAEATSTRSNAAAEEKDAKQALIGLVTLFGHAAAGSEHSHTIRGALHTAMVTGVTSTSLDEAKVDALNSYLNGNERFDIFSRLFSTRIKHELVAGAEQVLLTADMPEHMRKRVKQMFAECIKVTDSAPRVKVELLAKEPKQPRKRATKKQAVQA